MPEPVEYPIDPGNPPGFPGTLPRELSASLRDRLQKMAEEVNPYLGPDHQVVKALDQAAHELALSVPFEGRYASSDTPR